MEKAFLRYIHRRYCQFEESSEKVDELENGVKRILRKVLERIESQHPILSIEKIVEGGSFYEQTKIGAPDEFDFMVVLKNLSVPSMITIKDGCFKWYNKVYVTENEMIKGFVHDGKLVNAAITEKFWAKLLVQCKNEVISETTKSGTITTVACKNRKLILKYVENSRNRDHMQYSKESKSDSKELVHVPSMEIGVDLMLAIEYPHVEKIITADGLPTEWRHLVRENGCHLVAKNCHSIDPCTTCWHVSLAASELQLMRKMDQKHKQSYQVLKYLLIREVPHSGKCANLSSYMLKNAFMFHVYGHNVCSHADIRKCVHAVLEYLIINFRNGKMPCFLSRNIDTWGPTLKFPILMDEGYTRKFMGEVHQAAGWYAVCWLELWRRVTMRGQKLLKEVVTADDSKTQDTFYLMKESMMLLIECYCKYRNITQETPDKSLSLPTGVSEQEIDKRFTWYFGRLTELFDVKLGNLL